VLIHLNVEVSPRYVQGVHPDPTEWEGKTSLRNIPNTSTFGDAPRIGFDPVESFVRDIQVCSRSQFPGMKLTMSIAAIWR
jgi:hypothetical protein